MDFRFTEEQERFRQEVLDFIELELTPEVKAYSDGPNRWIGATPPSMAYEPYRDFVRKLGAKGWLSHAWPKEYGGQERSIIYEYILFETLKLHGAPVAGMGAHVVAPTLLKVGTEEQKKRYLPPIAKADVEFCLGYSEPKAGTDLAGIETKAVKDGDYYIIHGQKIFITAAHYADYCWLVARTDPDSKRHRGLTLFIAPMHDPAVSVSPMITMAGGRTNLCQFENLKVHRSEVIGEEGRGWYYMAVALDLERLKIYGWSTYLPTLFELVGYCQKKERNGKPLLKETP